MRDSCDIGGGRIAEMDAAGIEVQVVWLTAPVTLNADNGATRHGNP
jgi:hypothetical protein